MQRAQTMFSGIFTRARMLSDPVPTKVTKFFNDEFPEFFYWTGSGRPEHHHYSLYGLSQHTMEVIDFAMAILRTSTQNHDKQPVNPSSLFYACLFHDLGKIWDYRTTNAEMTEWTVTDHKRLIHHISRSHLEWHKMADKFPAITDEIRWEVAHAILSHHESRDWGSPVSPKGRLAWIVCLADKTSARLDDCDRLDLAAQPKRP